MVSLLARSRSRRGTPHRSPLAGDQQADIAIVGGGFTGLWTAIELLERRRSRCAW